MKFAIVGAGSIGGYFGARLQQSGHEVTLIARGQHLAAIREHGLRVRSELGEIASLKISATDDPASIGPVDAVLVSVKLWDTDAALESAKPLIGPSTVAFSLQNGVIKDEALAHAFGKEHVLGAVALISATVAEPGVIEHVGKFARIVLGELQGGSSARATELAAAMNVSGMEVSASDNMPRVTWEKFTFIVGMAGLTAVTRSTIGPVRENPETRELLRQTMQEVVDVARAQGANVDPGFADDRVAYCDTLPPNFRASMAADLERGRRLELPWFSGDVATRGVALGVKTPANAFITQALALYVMGT